MSKNEGMKWALVGGHTSPSSHLFWLSGSTASISLFSTGFKDLIIVMNLWIYEVKKQERNSFADLAGRSGCCCFVAARTWNKRREVSVCSQHCPVLLCVTAAVPGPAFSPAAEHTELKMRPGTEADLELWLKPLCITQPEEICLLTIALLSS